MHIEDPYVEIIGSVKEDNTLRALTSINMGKSLGTSSMPLTPSLVHSRGAKTSAADI